MSSGADTAPSATGVASDVSVTAIARLQARPGLEAAVRAQALALVAPTRAEPGNISYRPYEDPAAPGAWLILEEWADPESWQTHLASPHLEQALSRTASLLAEPPVVRVFPAV